MMHSKDEFVTIRIGRSTWQGLKSELNPNYENPERIWAYAWTGKEGIQGQWDYFDTSRYYGKVTEYVRVDLFDEKEFHRSSNEKAMIKYQKELHEADVRASKAEANAGQLHMALRKAEAALSDIGDSDMEPDDDIKWFEIRAAEVIPIVRSAIAAYKRRMAEKENT